MNWEALAHLLAFAVMLAGLVGVVLPFLPGIPLVWFGIFLSAIATRFQAVPVPFLALVGVLALLSYLPDYWARRWGFRKDFRITIFGVVGGVVGGLIGSLFGVLPGLTVGPVLGAVLGEMATGKDSMFCIETDAYRIIGYIGCSTVKTVLGVTMIGMWIAQVLS
jgi:uncharacterized protein YqgC (DUF456 family)